MAMTKPQTSKIDLAEMVGVDARGTPVIDRFRRISTPRGQLQTTNRGEQREVVTSRRVPFGLSSLAAVVCLALSCPAAVALTGLQDVAVPGSGTDEAGAFCSDFTLTAAQARSALQAAQPSPERHFLINTNGCRATFVGKRASPAPLSCGNCAQGEMEPFPSRMGTNTTSAGAGCRRRFGASRK